MLKLSFDVTTGNLVSWQGSIASLRAFRQDNTSVQLRFVQPDPDSLHGQPQFTPADTTTDYLGVRMGIWSNSTGTLDDSSPYLLALTPHTDFNYNTTDPDDPFYEGTFNCDTAEMATALGSGKSVEEYFAVGLVRNDLTIEVVYDQKGTTNCTVYSRTDDASGVLPVSALPGYHAITLPVYFRSTDLLRTYVLTENEAQNGLIFSGYTPPP